jgi:hypothetical protein
VGKAFLANELSHWSTARTLRDFLFLSGEMLGRCNLLLERACLRKFQLLPSHAAKRMEKVKLAARRFDLSGIFLVNKRN